jgi:hypothetical protein
MNSKLFMTVDMGMSCEISQTILDVILIKTKRNEIFARRSYSKVRSVQYSTLLYWGGKIPRRRILCTSTVRRMCSSRSRGPSSYFNVSTGNLGSQSLETKFQYSTGCTGVQYSTVCTVHLLRETGEAAEERFERFFFGFTTVLHKQLQALVYPR